MYDRTCKRWSEESGHPKHGSAAHWPCAEEDVGCGPLSSLIQRALHISRLEQTPLSPGSLPSTSLCSHSIHSPPTRIPRASSPFCPATLLQSSWAPVKEHRNSMLHCVPHPAPLHPLCPSIPPKSFPSSPVLCTHGAVPRGYSSMTMMTAFFFSKASWKKTMRSWSS